MGIDVLVEPRLLLDGIERELDRILRQWPTCYAPGKQQRPFGSLRAPVLAERLEHALTHRHIARLILGARDPQHHPPTVDVHDAQLLLYDAHVGTDRVGAQTSSFEVAAVADEAGFPGFASLHAEHLLGGSAQLSRACLSRRTERRASETDSISRCYRVFPSGSPFACRHRDQGAVRSHAAAQRLGSSNSSHYSRHET